MTDKPNAYSQVSHGILLGPYNIILLRCKHSNRNRAILLIGYRPVITSPCSHFCQLPINILRLACMSSWVWMFSPRSLPAPPAGPLISQLILQFPWASFPSSHLGYWLCVVVNPARDGFPQGQATFLLNSLIAIYPSQFSCLLGRISLPMSPPGFKSLLWF